jgi:hypothetical protein
MSFETAAVKNGLFVAMSCYSNLISRCRIRGSIGRRRAADGKVFELTMPVRMMTRMGFDVGDSPLPAAGKVEALEQRYLLSTLPTGWTDQDIGNPAHAGAASFDSSTGVWSQAGGARISGTAAISSILPANTSAALRSPLST